MVIMCGKSDKAAIENIYVISQTETANDKEAH